MQLMQECAPRFEMTKNFEAAGKNEEDGFVVNRRRRSLFEKDSVSNATVCPAQQQTKIDRDV